MVGMASVEGVRRILKICKIGRITDIVYLTFTGRIGNVSIFGIIDAGKSFKNVKLIKRANVKVADKYNILWYLDGFSYLFKLTRTDICVIMGKMCHEEVDFSAVEVYLRKSQKATEDCK